MLSISRIPSYAMMMRSELYALAGDQTGQDLVAGRFFGVGQSAVNAPCAMPARPCLKAFWFPGAAAHFRHVESIPDTP